MRVDWQRNSRFRPESRFSTIGIKLADMGHAGEVQPRVGERVGRDGLRSRTEEPDMVDTARSGFPTEMVNAAHPEGMGQVERMAGDVVDSISRYAHEQPVPALLWALGIGFVLGWRLKPW